jgi:hypothetical protein
VSLQAAVLLLTDIAFALLASAVITLSVKAVVIAKAVVPIIFTVRIKGFKQLLRLISIT